MRLLQTAILFISLTFALQAAEGKIYVHPAKDLAILDVTEKVESNYGRNQKHFNLKTKEEHKRVTPLYTVYMPYRKNGVDMVRYICKVPKSQFSLESAKLINPLTLEHKQYYQIETQKKPKLEVIKEASKYEVIQQEWRGEFKALLEKSIKDNEDHELELLLYLKEFNEMPGDFRQSNWKRNEAIRFLCSISGLSDIRDAIPLEKDFKTELHEYNKTPPEPIKLPQVVSKPVKLNDTISSTAKFIPRSCYYLELPDVDTFFKSLEFASTEFETWSKGTYPETISQIAEKYMKKVGLTREKLEQYQNEIESIAVAGWDPYFQSGTNMLIVLQFKDKVTLKSNHKLSYIDGNYLIISTGEKLLRMSKSAAKGGKSLRQVDNFRYARNRMSTQTGESEKLFVYLSDYWLMNFVSPRWRIHTRREAEVDARIRMAHLLKLTVKQEKGLKNPPSLTELREQFSSNKRLSWFLKDLVEKDGKISDKNYGTLFNHTPIDERPFDKVSKAEKGYYEQFRQMYEGRWKQIDPLAFQLVSDGKQWKSRLYISPISNRSFYRHFRNYVLKNKIKHKRRNVEGEAMGWSAILKTEPFKGMLPGLQLPLAIQPAVTAFDFAPHSLRSNHLLDEMPEYDEISFMRIPAFIELPKPVLDIFIGFSGRNSLTPSEFEGLQILRNARIKSHYFPYIYNAGEGTAYMSLDPNTLQRARNGLSEEFTELPVASDFHFFIDLKAAYMMHRRAMFEAVANRSVASWRRQNRIYRINSMLSLRNSVERLQDYFADQRIFPKANPDFQRIVNNMPKLYGEKCKWGTSLSNHLGMIPEIIQELRKIDLFASVEDNALFFELHLKFSPEFSGSGQTQPPRPGVQPEMNEGLDFEEE